MAITARYVGSLGGTPGALARMTATITGYPNGWADVTQWHVREGLSYSSGSFTVQKAGDYWIAAQVVGSESAAISLRVAVDATIIETGTETWPYAWVIRRATLQAGQKIRIQVYTRTSTSAFRVLHSGFFAIVPV